MSASNSIMGTHQVIFIEAAMDIGSKATKRPRIYFYETLNLFAFH